MLSCLGPPWPAVLGKGRIDGIGGHVRRASGFCHVYEADPSSVSGSGAHTLVTNIDVSSLSVKIVATH